MGKGKKREKKKASKKNKNEKNRKNYSMPENKRGKGRTKTNKQWDKWFNEFNDALKPRGLYTRDVDGDGNCLFRSIADQLDGDESVHRKYRDMAVEHVTKNKELFALYIEEDQNIDKILKEMSEDGTWGGFFELIALSAVLNVRFCCHLKDDPKPFFVQSFDQTKATKLVHLAYHVDQHYSSVRNIGDDTKLPAAEIKVEVFERSDTESSSDEDSDDDDEKEVKELGEGVEEMKIDDSKKKSKKKKNEEKTASNQEESEDSDKESDSERKSKWSKKKKGKNQSDSEDESKKNGKEARNKKKKNK